MAGEIGQYVRLVEQWRVSLGLSHTDFIRWVGRDPTEWTNMRAGRRQPSETFVRAVRQRAALADGPWLVAFDEAYQRDMLARIVPAAPLAHAAKGVKRV